MTEETPLDLAHATMQSAVEDDQARLAFYERVADAELFLLLEAEPGDDVISPILLETDHGQFVLAFDRAARLAAYVGAPAPYVAVSGRVIAGMLAESDLGLALNFEVAPSSILLPAGAVSWLNDTLAHQPTEVSSSIRALFPPKGLPETLITALDAKFATATGMAAFAWLAAVEHADGRRGHLLGFVDARPRAQSALVRAVSEALVFSGLDAGELDVCFFDHDHPVLKKLMKVGLRFDLPQIEPLQQTPRMPPGSDPERPPKLK